MRSLVTIPLTPRMQQRQRSRQAQLLARHTRVRRPFVIHILQLRNEFRQRLQVDFIEVILVHARVVQAANLLQNLLVVGRGLRVQGSRIGLKDLLDDVLVLL